VGFGGSASKRAGAEMSRRWGGPGALLWGEFTHLFGFAETRCGLRSFLMVGGGLGPRKSRTRIPGPRADEKQTARLTDLTKS
jgi:hypothetical protein